MKCKCNCGQITPIAMRNRYDLNHIKGEHIPYLHSHALRGRKRKECHKKTDSYGWKATNNYIRKLTI